MITRWTMRRLIHAYAVVRRDAMWWVPMMEQVLPKGKAATSGASSVQKEASLGSPQRRRSDGTYVWDKRRSKVNVVENTSPLERVAGFVVAGARDKNSMRSMSKFLKGGRVGMGKPV